MMSAGLVALGCPMGKPSGTLALRPQEHLKLDPWGRSTGSGHSHGSLTPATFVCMVSHRSMGTPFLAPLVSIPEP